MKSEDEPIIVENMNIFCPEGRLQIPSDLDCKQEAKQEPETEIETSPEEAVLDPTVEAWQAVDIIRNGIKKQTEAIRSKSTDK